MRPGEWMIKRERDEVYRVAFSNREEAIARAPAELNLAPGEAFDVATVGTYQVLLQGRWLLEELQNHAADQIGEASQQWIDKLDQATTVQVDELGDQVTKLVCDWLARHGLEASFFQADEVETHHAPEASER